jgi:hypothetical protein
LKGRVGGGNRGSKAGRRCRRGVDRVGVNGLMATCPRLNNLVLWPPARDLE